MYLKIGNHAPKEAFREDVDPNNHSADDLRSLAEKRGVSLDDNPTKDLIAARLSAQPQFRRLNFQAVTEVNFPDDITLGEAFNTITAPGGVWEYHSDAPPAWVESDSEGLAMLLSEHWGCDIGAPRNLEADYHTEHGPPGVGPKGPLGQREDATDPDEKAARRAARRQRTEDGYIALMLFLYFLIKPFLRTNAGADHQSRVMADTSSNGTGSYAAANYIGLSEATLAPAATHTFLTQDGSTVSEIFGASNTGLSRQQATYAHTNGTTTYTLTKQFTMGASDGASRNIQKIGVFNAAVTAAPTTTSGTLAFTTAVPSPPTLVQGDQITVTETVSLT